MELNEKRLEASTIKLWTGHKLQWKDFCELYGFDPFIWTQERLQLYAAYKFKVDDLAAETVRNHTYAIRDLALSSFNIPLRVDCKAMPFLHGMYKGRNIEKPPGTGSRLITSDIIKLWFDDVLHPDCYDNQVHRTAMTMAHNTLRRSDEILRENMDGLKIGNIIFENGSHIPQPSDKSAIFVFNFSKTNKYGRLQSAPLFHLCKFGEVCCLCELNRLYNWRNKIWDIDQRLFLFKNKSFLTYPRFNNKIKECCSEVGMDPTQYSSHGYRGGGNYNAKVRGVSQSNRMHIAGWDSIKTMLKYEKKMEPHHLHRMIARDLGLSDLGTYKSRDFEETIRLRLSKMAAKDKLARKTLKESKDKLCNWSAYRRKLKRHPSWKNSL